MNQTGYDFYLSSYGGNIVPLEDWKRLSLKAEQRLEFITFGRMTDEWKGQLWENKAKYAVCEMVEFLYKQESRDGKTSENTDGYSVSYEKSDKSIDGNLYSIARVYLANTGLMSLVVN